MDQTNFDNSQQQFQAPPEELAKQEAVLAAQQSDSPTKKPINKKTLILMVSVAVTGVLIVVALIISFVRGSNQMPVVRTTPRPVILPTNPPQAATEFGRNLEKIEQELNQVDPNQVELDSPPVNYQIRL